MPLTRLDNPQIAQTYHRSHADDKEHSVDCIVDCLTVLI